MHGKNNGGRVVLVDGDGIRAETDEQRHERARAMATGVFRGHVASAAARIASGMVAAGPSLVDMPEHERDALALAAVDLARRLVIESHKSATPTDDELEG